MALNFPDSPTIGQVYNDSTSGFSYEWDGTVWQSFSSSSLGQIKIFDDISGSFNGSTQTFALTSNTNAITPANAQQIRVVLGGVIQDPADDYTVSGSNITFTTPPTGGLSFSGIVFGTAVPVNTIPDGTVTDGSLRISTTAVVGSATTFTEDLVVSGDARVTGILTIGTSSITLDGSTNTITVGSGFTISSTGITGSASTVTSAAVAYTLEGSPNLNVGVVTASSFVGNVTGDATGLSGTPNIVVGIATVNTTLSLSGNYVESVNAVAALDIDCSAGNYFTKTINGTSTFTFSNVPSSVAYCFTLELTHTSGSVTWPAAVKWAADTAPTLTTGKTHLFMFVTDDGGSRWRGAALVDYTN